MERGRIPAANSSRHRLLERATAGFQMMPLRIQRMIEAMKLLG